MKYLYCFLFSLVLVLQGCSSDDGVGDLENPSDFYFRFKVDGTQEEYRYNENLVNLTGINEYDDDNGVNFVNVAGLRAIVENKTNYVSVFVSDTRGISTGLNYSNIPGEGDGYPDFVFSMGYCDSDGGLYTAAGAGDGPMYGLYEAAFVEFSAITDAYISGTFSGKLNRYENSSGTNVLMGSVVISEGEFKVPRIPRTP